MPILHDCTGKRGNVLLQFSKTLGHHLNNDSY